MSSDPALMTVPVALVQTPIAALVVQDCHVTLLFVGSYPMTIDMLGQIQTVAHFEDMRPICRAIAWDCEWAVGRDNKTGALVKVDWDADTDWEADVHSKEDENELIEQGGRVARAVNALPLIVLAPSCPTRS